MHAVTIPKWPLDTDKVRELMRIQAKTQGALGTRLGVGRPTANKYLSGLLPVGLDDAVRIADWLGVPLDVVTRSCAGGCGCVLHVRSAA